ncbi:MAG: carboxypeptidase regulatory-like domain-containing protein [Gemmatales bacterium]
MKSTCNKSKVASRSQTAIKPRRFRPQLEILEDRVVPATIHWNLDTSGFWDDAANWDLNRVPNSNDDVIIDRGTANPTVTIRSTQYALTVTSTEKISVTGGDFHAAYGGNTVLGGMLELNGGNLVNDGTLRITGDVNWYSGITVGPVVFAGTTHVLGSSDKGSYRSLIANEGHMIMEGSGGFVPVDIGYTIENRVGAVFEIQSDADADGMSFINYGTVRKTGGTGESILGSQYSNFVEKAGSLVEGNSGKLTLYSRYGEGCTINAGAGAVVDLTGGGSYSWTGTYTGTGPGRVELSSGGIYTDNNNPTIFNFPQGVFHWTGGAIGGGQLVNQGYIQISGDADKYVWNGGISNFGHILQTGLGNVVQVGGGLFRNKPTGVYEINGDGDVGGYFYNEGLFRKIGGTGETKTSTPDQYGNKGAFLHLGGTVEALSGKLTLGGGNESTGGILKPAAGAVIELNGGFDTYLNGTYSIIGDGKVLQANASITTGPTLIIDATQGHFVWTGGTFYGYGLTTQGDVEVTGPDGKALDRTTWNIQGTVRHTGGSVYGTRAVIDINPGGVYDMQGDFTLENIVGSGQLNLINRGLFRKSAGVGEAFLNNDYTDTNNGTFEVLSGTLSLPRNGTFNGVNFNVAAGTLININDRLYNAGKGYAGLIQGHGLGHVLFQATMQTGGNDTATFKFDPGVATIGRDTYFGGTFVIQGQLTFNSPTYIQWRGGFTNQGTMDMVGPSGLNFYTGGVSFDNQGTINFLGDNNLTANSGYGYPVVFTNSGTIRKIGGTGTSNIFSEGTSGPFQLTNTGTIEALTGTLSIASPTSALPQFVSGKLTGGTWKAGPGATLTLPNAGAITNNQANITLTGPGANFTNIAGLTRNEGTLRFDQGKSFTTTGNFTNTGRLEAGSGSTFQANGTLTLTGTSIVHVDITGSVASGAFGKVKSTGAATLAGTLEINLQGYGPSSSEQYPVMGYASKAGSLAAITGLDPYLSAFVNSTAVVLNGQGTPPDLDVISITPSVNGIVGQDTTVNYVVKNLSNTPANGIWKDAIYLSRDRILSPDDKVLGLADHTGIVDADGTYQGSLTAAVPNLIDGNYYIIVVADAKHNVADSDRSNNSEASTSAIAVQISNFGVGLPASGSLSLNQPVYYRLIVPSDQPDLLLHLQTSVGTAVELFAAQGRLPTTADFDLAGAEFNSNIATALLSNPGLNTWYVMAVARTGSSSNFTLSAVATHPMLTSASPNKIGNTGNVTLSLSGNQLRASDLYQIVAANGTTFTASQVAAADSRQVNATFTLNNAPLGQYTVQLVRNGQIISLADKITVEAVKAARFVPTLAMPGSYRAGLIFQGAVVYRNDGNVDMPAPVIILTGNATTKIALERQDLVGNNANTASNERVLLGIGKTSNPGILHPGEEARIPFWALESSGGGASVNVDYQTADSNDPIDWAAVSAEMRPAGLTDARWNSSFALFQSAVGSTWGQYVQFLSRYVQKVKYQPEALPVEATYLLPNGTGMESAKYFETVEILDYAFTELRAEAGKEVGGTVFLENSDHPLAGVLVRLSNDTDSTIAYTDKDGVYRLPHLPNGTYSLSVEGYLLSSPISLNLDGSVINHQDITVLTGGVVEGFVQRSGDAAILSGLPVIAQNASGLRLTAYTDGNGHYRFTGLPTGLYLLSTSGPGLASVSTTGFTVLSIDHLSDVNLTLPLASVISGQVKGNNAALAGATLILRDAQGRTQSTRSDNLGKFSFGQLLAGTYTLFSSNAGFATQQQSISIGTGVEAALPVINLASGGVITLTIKNIQNQLLSNVSAILGQNHQSQAAGLSNNQGVLSFSDLAAGTYDLVITADQYNPQQVSIVVGAGATTGQTITLDAAGKIQGNVKDAAGQPINNMVVNFFTSDVLANFRTLATETDAQGNYSLTLPYGNYGVSFGNNTGIYRQSVTLDAAHLVQTVNIMMTGATLSGRVMSSNGLTAIAAATVELRQSGMVLATANTLSDGTYTFRGLAAGQYSLQADSELGYTVVQTIDITANSTSTAGDLLTGSLSYQGVVFGSNHLPLSGASVGLFLEGETALGADSFHVTSDDGHYAFPGVIAGNYVLRIEAPHHATYEQHLTIGTSTTQDISLIEGVSFSGTVLFQGQPVKQAVVAVITPGSLNSWAITTTNDQGQFTLENLPPGVYSILVKPSLQQIQLIENVAVNSGMPAFNINLAAQTTSLQGVVNDESGQPLSLATIQAINQTGDVLDTLITDQFGYYESTKLPPGEYHLKVRSLGYRGQELVGMTLDAGVPLSRNFSLTTAGTDDPPGYLEIMSDLAAGVLAAPIRLIIDGYVKDTLSLSVKPERFPNDPGTLSELAIPGSDACSEKERLYLLAIKAYDKKEAAFKDWNTVYDDFNNTFKNGAALFSWQMIDLAFSVFKAAESSAIKAAFDAAGNATRITYALYQAEQLVEAIHKAIDLPSLFHKIVSGNAKFSDLMGIIDGIHGVLDKGKSQIEYLDRFINLLNPDTESKNLSIGWLKLSSWVGILIKLIKAENDAYTTRNTLESLADNTRFAQKAYLKALTEFKSAKREYDDYNCDDPEDTKPKPPKHGPRASIGVWRSLDPNQLQSTGVGDYGAVRPGETISYTANFENLPTADAPAQIVKITLPLSSNLDWSTLQITGIGFNDVNLALPPGLKNYETTVTSSSDPSHPVKVTISFNAVTGELVAVMQSIDPLTGQATDDPAAGFLPPDDATGRGRGYLTFDIQAKSNLTAGTEIKNQASIVFDANAPLATNQSLNTIDTETPVTKVNTLPATTTNTSFTVNWTGQDPHHGAGIVSYNIYVSTNNGPFTLWKDHTTDTSAVFTGEKGKKYSFYSTAVDGLGFEEDAPTTYDAVIEVLANLKPSIERISVANGEAQRSRFFVVQVYFNTIVTFDKGAFELYLNGKRFTISGILTSIQDGKTVATLQFLTSTLVKTSLPEGQYRLVTRAKSIKAQTGGLKMESDQTDSFFRLFGDVNGDGRVDATDLAVFNTTYGKKAGQTGYLWFLDFDGNGKIDAKDQAAIRSRLRR